MARSGIGYFLVVLVLCLSEKASAELDSDLALGLLDERARANAGNFFVYRDADSGLNHGFPSGFLGALAKVGVKTACIDDGSATDGCSPDLEALDVARGTVAQIAFDPLSPGEFAGVHFQEPEAGPLVGIGYDLSPATEIVFDARAPGGASVRFGVDYSVTSFLTVPSTWTEFRIPLASFSPPVTDVTDVHLLFSVLTNDLHAPSGATVLVDDVRFEPVPARQALEPSLPVGNTTFGVVARDAPPIPADQAIRNLATIYEAAISSDALLDGGTAPDLAAAVRIADALVYALGHDNSGAPLPTATDGSTGLHDAYSDGDLALLNDQGPAGGQAGEIRFAGFTVPGDLCSETPGVETSFCLVLDGATGGNNAFAILAFVRTYRATGHTAYLDAAREIAAWIRDRLTADGGYGGYYLGYTDEGLQTLVTGKSVENNADIFSAFKNLASVEEALGNAAEAAELVAAANVAGDFVMTMFDPAAGRFNVGTVPAGTPAGCGIDPDAATELDGEVINTADFLDPNTFATLALARSPRYFGQIDWRRPLEHTLATFAVTVEAAGETFSGFSLVSEPLCGPGRPDPGPKGVAWEFTGQMVVTARFVDAVYGETTYEPVADFYLSELGRAQNLAPFTDGRGLPGATLDDGSTFPLALSCLNTPLQCIPERTSGAATAWAVAAHRNINFLPEPSGPLQVFAGLLGVGILNRVRERTRPTTPTVERTIR